MAGGLHTLAGLLVVICLSFQMEERAVFSVISGIVGDRSGSATRRAPGKGSLHDLQ